MKRLCRSAIPAVMLAAAILVAVVQPASAAKQVLFGTTGSCKNDVPGGPCTQLSTLVQIDPQTGALIRVIGPVGFTVNGLTWSRKSHTLYASTSIGCGPGLLCPFHGLITIDPLTGAGYPVDPTVHNFGLPGPDSPIHSISADSHGRIVGWYDEFGNAPGGGNDDTFVKIDPRTGIATEFQNTGIDTSANGLSFDEVDNLWNIDSARRNGQVVTQTAYLIDAFTGKPFLSVALNPPEMAALGDFNPVNNLYYGLDFTAFSPSPTFIVVVDPRNGTTTQLGQTVDDLHTLAFAKVKLD
jgi:hypothetical protein